MKLKTDKVLTPAETRVAAGYAAGMIGKEIADAEGISHNTVVRHTQRIYDKTGIPHSTNALVAWFLEKNYDLDLSELRRGIGAALLLLLFTIFTFKTDFSGDFIRGNRTRRIESRRAGRRGQRKDYQLTTI